MSSALVQAAHRCGFSQPHPPLWSLPPRFTHLYTALQAHVPQLDRPVRAPRQRFCAVMAERECPHVVRVTPELRDLAPCPGIP